MTEGNSFQANIEKLEYSFPEERHYTCNLKARLTRANGEIETIEPDKPFLMRHGDIIDNFELRDDIQGTITEVK